MKHPRFSDELFRVSAGVYLLPQVDKVLFISERCLPMASLTNDLLAFALLEIVNLRDTPTNVFPRHLQFDKIKSSVPLKFKADQMNDAFSTASDMYHES